uniref:Transmembrane protein n=1 Tax=Caenorhabditis japonica TaxID=281687 RepID=A0A8R1HR65_CAEJA
MPYSPLEVHEGLPSTSSFFDWILSPPYEHDIGGWNSTDVLCANCIGDRNIIACVRSSVIAFLGVCTAVLCFARIVKLHATSQSQLMLLLYYVLAVHCIGGSFEWLIGWNTQISLFLAYTKAVCLLIVCYFYLDIASSMMHWSSTAGKRLCFVALFLLFTYFTAFLVMGYVLASIEQRLDCRAPYWIWFSVGEFLIVQMTLVSFCMIIRRMNRISAPWQMHAAQRRDIFVLMWAFETATFCDMAYHIGMFMLADEHSKMSCSAIFDHDQIRYSILKAPYDLVNFIMPAWSILYVFRTKTKLRADSEDSGESSTTSTLSSAHSRNNVRIADVVTVRNWRRRYRPLTQPSASERPVLHSQWRQNRINSNVVSSTSPSNQQPANLAPRLRTVSSAPMIRRMSVSHSIVSSPLYSIPEEFQFQLVPTQNAIPPALRHQEMYVGSLDSLAPLIDEPLE